MQCFYFTTGALMTSHFTLPRGREEIVTIALKMELERESELEASRKKRCIGEEKRRFQARWTNAYFVVPHGSDKVMCLICKQVNTMLKELNINRHYAMNHKSYEKFTGEERISSNK